MIKIFVTLLSTIVSSPIQIEIEFGRDQIPQIISDLEIGQLWTSGVRNIFHSGSETRLFSNSLHVYEGPPVLHIPSLIPVLLSAHTCHVTGGGDIQLLAIGPGSDIAMTFGSVALVHETTDSGFLLLNSTETEFLSQYCLPDSLIRIPTHTNRTQGNMPQTMGRIPSISNDTVPIRFTPIAHILKLHPNIFEELFDQVALILNGSIYTIPNCTHMRQLLPDLQIQLTSDRMITLSPQDYTRFKNNGLDECDLLVGVSVWIGDASAPVEMNPLLIPGFNSFATSNFLILCEALQYRE